MVSGQIRWIVRRLAVEFKVRRFLFGAEERQLAAWVVLNRDILLRYWDGEIECTEDVLTRLRPV